MKKYVLVGLGFGLAGLMLFVSCDDLFPWLDEFEPSGDPFYLNPDIEVVSITGKDQGFPDTGTFPLSMTARSKTSGQESDILPAGLLFRSTRNQVQHMLMLKDHAVTVDTNVIQFELGTFCCNEFREIPRDPDTLEIGPITDNSGLQELVSLVHDKDISKALWMVQRAVWLVTDSTGLTQAYRDSINALPPDTSRVNRFPD